MPALPPPKKITLGTLDRPLFGPRAAPANPKKDGPFLLFVWGKQGPNAVIRFPGPRLPAPRFQEPRAARALILYKVSYLRFFQSFALIMLMRIKFEFANLIWIWQIKLGQINLELICQITN